MNKGLWISKVKKDRYQLPSKLHYSDEVTARQKSPEERNGKLFVYLVQSKAETSLKIGYGETLRVIKPHLIDENPNPVLKSFPKVQVNHNVVF